MEKHTKGNWSVDGYNTASVISDINGYIKIADCALAGAHGNDALQFQEENKANAKLIAAAPEMLEALKAIMETMREVNIKSEKDAVHIISKIGSRALTAIKKATDGK